MTEDEDIINEDGELIQNEAMEEDEIEEEEDESTDEEEAAKVDLDSFSIFCQICHACQLQS